MIDLADGAELSKKAQKLQTKASGKTEMRDNLEADCMKASDELLALLMQKEKHKKALSECDKKDKAGVKAVNADLKATTKQIGKNQAALAKLEKKVVKIAADMVKSKLAAAERHEKDVPKQMRAAIKAIRVQTDADEDAARAKARYAPQGPALSACSSSRPRRAALTLARAPTCQRQPAEAGGGPVERGLRERRQEG